MRKLSQRWLTGLFCLGVPALPLVACSEFATEEDLASMQEALTVTQTFQQGASSYTGSTDATLRQAAATTNYGAATTCEIDGDDGSGVDKSCLLRWALTGVPSDAIITSASITVRVVDPSSNAYSLYSVSRAWNEGEATWNRATSSVNWATAGALGSTDRGAVVGSITGSSAGSKTVTLNAAGIAMVQGWV
ncbi:MAG TPA: DNRLRE domain-containing protein, partial [Polyangiaceae bacterium]